MIADVLWWLAAIPLLWALAGYPCCCGPPISDGLECGFCDSSEDPSNSVTVSLSGVADNACSCCNTWNGDYVLTTNAPASTPPCDTTTDSCGWAATSYTSRCCAPFGPCLDPYGGTMGLYVCYDGNDFSAFEIQATGCALVAYKTTGETNRFCCDTTTSPAYQSQTITNNACDFSSSTVTVILNC